MFYSPIFIPLTHGAAGILDELLFYGAPLIVVVIILIISSRRARGNAPSRQRPSREAAPHGAPHPPDRPE